MLKNIIKKFIRVKKEKVVIPCLEGSFLKNRHAFITGGSTGIGYEIAKSFLKNGATVIITGRNEEKLKKAKDKLIYDCNCNLDDVKIEKIDLNDVSTIREKISKILKENNYEIDILVNNAGVNCGEYFPNTSEADYDLILDTNLKGTYFVSQFFADYMVKNHIKGNILNVTSSSSLRPAVSPYILSKWGERALTLGMAKKYMKYDIVVNAIAPGSTATSMVSNNSLNDLSCDYTPMKRYIAAEEVANISTILVSNMGRMIIGDTIYITGGSGILTYDDMNY